MIEIVEYNKKYIFKKKQSKIRTQKGYLLEVNNKTHANLIISEILNKKKLKDPYSLINLTFFSCDLNDGDKEEIKRKIIEILNFDLTLYRCYEEEEFKVILEKNFKPYVTNFQEIFKTKLILINSMLEYNDVKSIDFKIFLDNLHNFELTILFKLATLTRSVILSFNFLKKRIDYNSLYKLSNLEYTYQQKQWGLVDEQKLINRNNFLVMKNISFFLKNIN